MNGSLVHRLFPELTSDNVYNNPEVSVTNNSAPQWNSLPKYVWVIWTTGYSSAPVTNQLAF